MRIFVSDFKAISFFLLCLVSWLLWSDTLWISEFIPDIINMQVTERPLPLSLSLSHTYTLLLFLSRIHTMLLLLSLIHSNPHTHTLSISPSLSNSRSLFLLPSVGLSLACFSLTRFLKCILLQHYPPTQPAINVSVFSFHFILHSIN